MRPAGRTDNSAVLVVLNIKVRMEVQYCVTPVFLLPLHLIPVKLGYL
jgi:hypothetical protein